MITTAAKKHDAQYAEFAARMLAAEELAIQYASDASRKLHATSSHETQTAATVRPSK